MSWFLAIRDIFVDGLKKTASSALEFIDDFDVTYNQNTGRLEVRLTGGGGGGSGDVVGPASSVDQRVPVFSGTTGKLLAQSAFLIADLIKRNGSTAYTADQSMGGFKLTDLGAGSAGTDSVNKAQMDASIAAAVTAVIDWKSSVKAATTAALAASTRVANVRTANANGAFPTVDGVTIALNDAILDKDHATGADRGVWVLTDAGSGGTPWVLTRRGDFDADAEVTTGAAMLVEQGTANGGRFFFLSTTGTITVNTTSLTFTALTGLPVASAAGQTIVWNGSAYVAGALDLADSDATTGELLSARLPSQLGARGAENVVVDLYPSTQSQGTLATAASATFDVAIATGRRYTITASVWVDDGAGGACLYTKALQITAHQTGGVAVKVADVTMAAPLEGAGFAFTAGVSTTNIRFTLANTSGSTRSYNCAIGFWAMDKP
jgi:hypothetical protein